MVDDTEAIAKFWQHDDHAWLREMRNAGTGTDSADMARVRRLRKAIWGQTYRFASSLPPHMMLHGWRTDGTECSLYHPTVSVVDDDVLDAANKAMNHQLKVAILCFGNNNTPGGGVSRGAGAQEEYLYRCTSIGALHLQFSLQQKQLYPLNDQVVVVEGVKLLRASEEAGYKVDPDDCAPNFRTLTMLIAAAPRDHGSISEIPDTHRKMETVIRNILTAVPSDTADELILGAFGCGAFKHDPSWVASVFKANLAICPIKKIVFAIKNDHNARRNAQNNFQRFYETLHSAEACCNKEWRDQNWHCQECHRAKDGLTARRSLPHGLR